AATSLQSALDGTNSQSSSTATAATTCSTANTDSSGSTFVTDLKALLAAVQSGDATASKTAADTLIKDLKNSAEASQDQPMGPPPGQSSSLGNTLASLLQSAESGDMTDAQSAATSLQSALDSMSSTATAATTSSTAITDSAQSNFLTDLKGLLSAVQSGDA